MPAEKIPGWIERLLLPKLSEISGDVRALDVKIESLRNETKAEIASLRNEIDSKFQGLDYRFEGIDHRFEGMDHRFEAINTRLDSIEKHSSHRGDYCSQA